MILSVSRRTDIPCCYAEWFQNRIREGFCLTRNPMNPAQLYRIPMTLDVVDAIVFWTKDPQPILPFLPELQERGYPFYFQFTVTPYGKELEPGLREKEAILRTFRALSEQIGKERVVWRYDPIVRSESISLDFHKKKFREMCDRLADLTQEVVVSFYDEYAHLRKTGLRPLSIREQQELAGVIGETAKAYGLRTVACCEKMNLAPYGIEPSACIDPQKLQKICGEKLLLTGDKNQRHGCGCCESVDIGMYHTCSNGCAYCYANHSASGVRKNVESHRPESPILCGGVGDGEPVRERAVSSYKVTQMSFF